MPTYFSTPETQTAAYGVGLRNVDGVWTWADGSVLDVPVESLPWYFGATTQDCAYLMHYLEITADGCDQSRSILCQTDAAGACDVIVSVRLTPMQRPSHKPNALNPE